MHTYIIYIHIHKHMHTYTQGYDLVHFGIVFTVVFFGYVFSGVLLFGHQFEAFSTVQRGIVFLYFQIMAFDNTEFWGDMQHAAPDWAFHIWAWSFMFIVLLILINILLSMIIEGYIRVSGLYVCMYVCV